MLVSTALVAAASTTNSASTALIEEAGACVRVAMRGTRTAVTWRDARVVVVVVVLAFRGAARAESIAAARKMATAAAGIARAKLAARRFAHVFAAAARLHATAILALRLLQCIRFRRFLVRVFLRVDPIALLQIKNVLHETSNAHVVSLSVL